MLFKVCLTQLSLLCEAELKVLIDYVRVGRLSANKSFWKIVIFIITRKAKQASHAVIGNLKQASILMAMKRFLCRLL